MPELEDNIRNWRGQMLATGIKSPIPLAELELHLREDIDRRMSAGASSQVAFDAAVRQFGPAGVLKVEFAKVGQVMSARQRKINWLICAAASIFYGALGAALLFPGLLDPLASRERMPMAGACVLIAILLCSWRFSSRFLPAIPGKRMRTAIAFLSIVLSGFCSAILLHRTPGAWAAFFSSASVPIPFVIAVLWALLPGATAVSLIFGLEEAAYHKVSKPVS